MEVWDLNLRHLQAVVEVVRLGTLNAAAKRVNLTQPAITQALGRLEGQLGAALFERQHTGMTATPAAEVLTPRIEAALAHIASPHVTMARLRALLLLSQSGSYAAASAASGLSQPSVHRAVSDLALSMRKTLVVRRGKTVLLTDAGLQLVRAFKLAVVELEVGLSEIDALRGVETRRLRIGAMPLSRAKVLPSVVTAFMRRHPEVKISVIEGSRAELIEPLRAGALDFMVGALRQPLLENDLVQRTLFADRPMVIGRRGHPLAGKKPKPRHLARFSWTLAAPDTPLRQSWERFFWDAGVDLPPVPVESGSVMMIRQILMETDFLTLLSPEQFAPELEAGWLQPITELPSKFERTIGMTIRATWRPTRVQQEFIDMLEAAARAIEG
jgi:DNA-binding transcriptional LysR family regulator